VAPEASVVERARALKLMGFDVDGVLTDGALVYSERGEEAKAFHTLDGLGMQLLQGAGVTVALITGRRSRVVTARAAELGIAHVFQASANKLATMDALRSRLNVPLAACGYMGDDLPDLPLLTRCGFAATVPEAPEPVRARVHYISGRSAGRGAVREVCDLILAAQGALDAAVAKYCGDGA
jgi:3-deoxy-D-manno-octulosonate 8-phosphate phosphatase (KDO 8-P phosphatase)